MRRASLAALTLAGAAGIHAAPPGPRSVELEEPAGPRSVTARDLAERRGRYATTTSTTPRPAPATTATPASALGFLQRDPDPDLRARARHRPARALGGRGGLRVHRRLAEPRLVTYAQEGADTGFDADFRVRSRQVDASSQDDRRLRPRRRTACPTTSTRARGRHPRAALRRGRRPRCWAPTSPSTYEFRLVGTAFDYTDDGRTSLVPRQHGRGQRALDAAPHPGALGRAVRQLLLLRRRQRRRHRAQRRRGRRRPDLPAGRDAALRGGLGYADRHREGDDSTPASARPSRTTPASPRAPTSATSCRASS